MDLIEMGCCISVLQGNVGKMEQTLQNLEETFKSILPDILDYLNEGPTKTQQLVKKLGMNFARLHVLEPLEIMERICLEDKKRNDEGHDKEDEEKDDEEEDDEEDDEDDDEDDNEHDEEDDEEEQAEKKEQ